MSFLKSIYKTTVFLFVLTLLVSCSNQFEGYVEKPSGLLFKLETIEEGVKRIKKNNYLQFKYSFKDYAGKVYDESRILLKVNDVFKSGGLVETLSLVNEKEIASAIFPVGKLREELDGAFALNGLPDTTLLYTQVLIDSIYELDEFLSARKKFVSWINEADTKDFDVIREENAMDAFESENGISTEKTVTGLRYFFIRRGRGEESGYGKRVELKYTGRFLSGEEFNTTESLPNKSQDFYVGQEMQVIKGIEEALMFMREGDAILLLIPSWMGFGQKGSSTGIVPPKTPIIYEVELNKVN